MSVVNKMLQDLDSRGSESSGDSADYEKSGGPTTKRLGILVGVLLIIVAGYFGFRALGKEFFIQLLNQIGWQEEQTQEQVKQVSVTSELDKMMPARNDVEVPAVEEKVVEKPGVSEPANLTESEPIEQTQLEAAIEETAIAEPETNILPDSKEVLERESAPKVPLNRTPLNRTPIKGEETSEANPESSVNGSFQVSRSASLSKEEQIQKMLAVANDAVQVEEFSKAISNLDAILEIAPDRFDVRKRLAVLLYSNNQEARAERLLRDGIVITPNRTDLRMMLGRLLHKQGKAIELYDALRDLNPTLDDNSEYVALKASAAQQLDMHSEAAAMYEQLVGYESEESRWWLGLAISRDRLGNGDSALSAYMKVVELNQLSGSVMDFVRTRIEALGG